MANTPDDRRYTDSHEWALQEADGTVKVGITDHAQELLGDLVFVELPEIGSGVGKGEECCVVESVKAASDVYSPVSGEIIAVNEALEEAPETINEDPYESGWLFIVRVTDAAELDELLDADGYEATIADD